ncbi:hypothetical protein [Mucilaginibacter sp.]|uniref:hypothetical protein n=1 Tax=Mucilaginibacter sp. TaxID=1882438 RepID=UPI0028520603|nr:hypothetical protein [Mucilaginibacter sp.]MDR3696226.1 hypothetical protein [Mucilaginibacter sp.]
MSISKTLFAVIALSISFCCVFGQGKFPKVIDKEDPKLTGYIVNTKGDTVQCNFKKPALGTLRYKPVNSTEKFKKPSTDDLKAYYCAWDSTMYEALPIDTDGYNPVFLKRLESGTIRLYEEDVVSNGYFMNGYYTGGGTNTYFYVSKDLASLKEIKSNTLNIGGESRKKRKAYLMGLIADDPDLAKQFDAEQDYDLKTLRHYIHDFNLFKSAAAK